MITECGNNCFIIDNGFIRRHITFDNQGLYTSSLVNLSSGTEYIKKPAIDFSFIADDVKFTSFTVASVREVDGLKEEIKNPFDFSGSRISSFPDGSETLAVEMQTASGIAVTVTYRIYPEIAGFRKSLIIRNAGGKTIKIRNIVFDNPVFLPGTPADCEFYFDFDRPSLPLFSTEAYEDVIRCYNPELKEGWFLGTDAPGVMRNFVVFPHWNSIQCACNRGGANLLKELAPGEEFTAPDSLWCCYNGELEDQGTVDGFRRLIRAGLPELKFQEGVMYCTWLPFLRNISSGLVDELSSRAADLGFKYFVIDDGWFKLKSNWQVDLEKFPEGLEEVSRKIREKGLKFGLWFNVGTDYGAIRSKQEYVQKFSDGTDKFFDENSERKVLCFGSEHRQDMLEAMTELARKYNVSYFKLDFSSVFSPYSFQSWGCHSKDHKYHKGFYDSIPAIYEGMMYLRTELKKVFPDILVDFSFECFGTQMPNIAALQYSELHHVSNYSANNPYYQKIDAIRRSFYNWLRVLPPERILNGLLSIQGDRASEYLLTSFSGAPLVAGDLRAVSQEQMDRMTKFVSAFKSATADGALTRFELVCNSRERDGFIRKNSNGKGIVCLFNRTDEVWMTDIRHCRNVETGSETVEVAPHDCAMFLLG